MTVQRMTESDAFSRLVASAIPSGTEGSEPTEQEAEVQEPSFRAVEILDLQNTYTLLYIYIRILN